MLGRPAIAAHPDVSELKTSGKSAGLLPIKDLRLP
jgi:hypothetical protein